MKTSEGLAMTLESDSSSSGEEGEDLEAKEERHIRAASEMLSDEL